MCFVRLCTSNCKHLPNYAGTHCTLLTAICSLSGPVCQFWHMYAPWALRRMLCLFSAGLSAVLICTYHTRLHFVRVDSSVMCTQFCFCVLWIMKVLCCLVLHPVALVVENMCVLCCALKTKIHIYTEDSFPRSMWSDK